MHFGGRGIGSTKAFHHAREIDAGTRRLEGRSALLEQIHRIFEIAPRGVEIAGGERDQPRRQACRGEQRRRAAPRSAMPRSSSSAARARSRSRPVPVRRARGSAAPARRRARCGSSPAAGADAARRAPRRFASRRDRARSRRVPARRSDARRCDRRALPLRRAGPDAGAARRAAPGRRSSCQDGRCASSSQALVSSRSASSHAPRHMQTDAYCVRHTANSGCSPHFRLCSLMRSHHWTARS